MIMQLNSLWDYLSAYNTFFILMVKIYIFVIIFTVIGYLVYLAYQKYMVPYSQAVKYPEESIDNKQEADQEKHIVPRRVKYVLWTGDMASTYTIISELLKDESGVVQPVYITRSSGQTWSKLEKLCMTDLRKLIIKRIPSARTRLLPQMNISAEIDDKAFIEVFWPKFEKLPQAVKPYYPLIQWAYYYKIRDPVLVAGFPGRVADIALVNKTSINSVLVDSKTGKLVTAKVILSMARESRVPFADILHKTCTCWQVGKARCGDCKGCLVIKSIQKRIIN